MNYSIGELRSIYVDGEDPSIGAGLQIMSMQEAAEMFALDEAFFGKKPVAKIQAAMDAIYKVVDNNPSVNLNNTPEERALEKAFCDVFGFNKCSIYWGNRPGLGFYDGNSGPCTMPASRLLHSVSKPLKYGTNQNGFYDKNHELKVYINTDQILFSQAGLSSSEMVAILLHEVGHNFDFSTWSIVKQWWSVLNAIIEIVLTVFTIGGIADVKKLIDSLTVTVVGNIVAELGGDVFQLFTNLDDMLMNLIPPIGTIVRLCRGVKFNIMKVIDAVLAPVSMGFRIPQELMMTPYRYLANMTLRKGEIYSDSFAASYGYGSELVTALEKLNVYTIQGDSAFLAPFYDLALARADIMGTIRGGHGSTQQRALRIIDKLDHDLEASGLSAADKADIMKEKKQLLDTYNKFLEADTGVQSAITKMYRYTIDNWYNGKNYMFIPMFQRDKQYAQ